MTPKFIMPSGYVTRTVELVLAPVEKGWRFYGRDHQGYAVIARTPEGKLLFGGADTFRTKKDAASVARTLNLPAYATWNGRKHAYDGKGAEFVAVARDAQS